VNIAKDIELEWARIADAQKFAPLSRATYYNLIESGRLKSRRIGGGRFICMASLRELFEKAPEKPSKKVSDRMRERAFASADSRAQNGD
jgi:hypothetical protein